MQKSIVQKAIEEHCKNTGTSKKEWSKLAKINPNRFTNIKNGADTKINLVSKLAKAAGMKTSEFIAMGE